jgi:hypothetical protein
MFFKRKKNDEKINPAKDRVARKIASFILKLQTRFANFMNSKTRNVSAPRMKILLIAFCLVSGSYSIYLTVHAFSKKNKATVTIDRIARPKHIDNDVENIGSSMQVTESDFKKIQAFKKYMDSLRFSTSGKRTYDSILVFRPGLMDSITFLEKIYLSQKK